MGFIFLVERGTQDLVLTVQRGVPPEFADEIKRLRMGESLSGWVAQTGKPRVVDNLLEERQLTTSLASRAGMRSFVAVPLMSRDRALGVMDLADEQYRRFSTQDVELLSSVGNEIGVAIENAYLYENMRYYAQQITRAQEDERARIARELHDDTIQSLIMLSRQVEGLARTDERLSPARARRLEELQRIIDEVIQGVRRFSRDLRPSILDDLGLAPALEGLAASLTEKDGILTRLWVTGEQRRLSPETELTLFRITQEALNNVKKHAEATQVVITVEFTDGTVEMTVRDNGKGFPQTARTDELAALGHLGLIGMHERARLLGGTLLIQSQVGLGTKIVVTVPATPPPNSIPLLGQPHPSPR
jgi:signal transduction histidine kinase